MSSLKRDIAGAFAVKMAVFLIRFYQLAVSPYLPSQCRYLPTCSEYALEVLKRYGLRLGCYLAFKRILRCHPWAKGGWDPIP